MTENKAITDPPTSIYDDRHLTVGQIIEELSKHPAETKVSVVMNGAYNHAQWIEFYDDEIMICAI